MVFDIRKDKILFISERYKYNNYKILILKNLSFLSITSLIIITRSFKIIVKNKSNEDNFDINSLKNIKKKSTSILKAFKERIIQKFNFLDIVEIDALIYYLIRNKENKLFSLIMNKIYDIFIKPFEVSSLIKRNNRISVNDLCLCDFKIKYKRCYKSYTLKST